MKGFDSPPTSFLPECYPVSEIDSGIFQSMKEIGYILNEKRDAEDIKDGVKCPVTVTYNILLQDKKEKEAKTKELERLKKEKEKIRETRRVTGAASSHLLHHSSNPTAMRRNNRAGTTDASSLHAARGNSGV